MTVVLLGICFGVFKITRSFVWWSKRIARYNFSEWQGKRGPGFGQLPVLEIDGKEIPQSRAIYRYVARKHGFYPSDDWGHALVEVVLETVRDFDPEVSKFFSQTDSKKREEIRKEFIDKGSNKYLDNIEKLLKNTNGGTGWFVGEKISLADILVFYLIYDVIPSLLGKEPGTFDLSNHELLHAFMKRFKSEPKISSWLGKRPKTPF
ncbi:glutathione S-transferase 3-like isoform X4 [Apostichopus japonicus]|uniref:glutathione S-transferase 3-like isoform X4 n=1 Tax=Stichopus japonicus TaxID=307972 RepID=UPI003AB53B3E